MSAWSFPVKLDDIPETGRTFEFSADEPTRRKIASQAEIDGVSRLQATIDVHRQGARLHASGQVIADVEQTCVVSLEPMINHIEEPIDITFAPVDSRAPERPYSETLIQHESEPLVNNIADLGAAATEFLLLAIDPYPRKEGAIFNPQLPEEPRVGPFAALADLKKKV